MFKRCPALQTTVPKRILQLFGRRATPAQTFHDDGSVNAIRRSDTALKKQFWHHVYTTFVANKSNQRADKTIMHVLVFLPLIKPGVIQRNQREHRVGCIENSSQITKHLGVGLA